MKQTFDINRFDKSLFWDVNISELDIERDYFYIIKRIILRGDKKDRDIMFALYDDAKVLSVVEQSREISASLKEVYQMALQ